MRILWWGRLGKALEFTAGLVVVLDLIGPDRLRAFGLRSQKRARYFFELLRRQVGALIHGLRGSRDPRFSNKNLITGAAYISLIALGGWAIWTFLPYEGWFGIIYWIYGIFALPLGLAGVIFALAVVGLAVWLPLTAIIWIAIWTLAGLSSIEGRLFNRKEPGHPARVLALGIFIVGFIFDLLAS